MLQTRWKAKREEESIFFRLHSINWLMGFEMASLQVQSPVQWGPGADLASGSVFAQSPLGPKAKPCHPKFSFQEGQKQKPNTCMLCLRGVAHLPLPVPGAHPRNSSAGREPGSTGLQARHRKWTKQWHNSPATRPRSCSPPGPPDPEGEGSRSLSAPHPLAQAWCLLTVLWEGLAVAQG